MPFYKFYAISSFFNLNIANKKLAMQSNENNKITGIMFEKTMLLPRIISRKILIICVNGFINTIVRNVPVKPSRGNNAVLKKKNGSTMAFIIVS